MMVALNNQCYCAVEKKGAATRMALMLHRASSLSLSVAVCVFVYVSVHCRILFGGITEGRFNLHLMFHVCCACVSPCVCRQTSLSSPERLSAFVCRYTVHPIISEYIL